MRAESELKLPRELLDLSRTLISRLKAVGIEGQGPRGRQTALKNVFVHAEYSGELIFSTFETDAQPARPYTTPQGVFLYLMDSETGRLLAYDQNRFENYTDVTFGSGVDLVTVGRFDRMNLFLGTSSPAYHLYDNVRREIVGEGEFRGTPLDARGSVDGRTALVAFSDWPELAMVELESGRITYVPATRNGAGAMALGLSNNVCH